MRDKGIVIFVFTLSQIVMQAIFVLLSALSYNGCSKYVVEERLWYILRANLAMWGISLLLTLALLIAAFPDFRQRGLLRSHTGTRIAFVSFVIWKAAALLTDIEEAGRCGEARDYYFPTPFAGISPDFLFGLTIATWLTMLLAVNVAILRYPSVALVRSNSM